MSYFKNLVRGSSSSSSSDNKSYQEVFFRTKLDCCSYTKVGKCRSKCIEKIMIFMNKDDDVDKAYTNRDEGYIAVWGNVDASKMARKLSKLLGKSVEIESARASSPLEALPVVADSSFLPRARPKPTPVSEERQRGGAAGARLM